MALTPNEILFTLFCTITFLQILYYLLFFNRVARYKTENKVPSETCPVSVIICARNEEENIATNLPRILEQQYATTHEVIIVNDNSTDNSFSVLAGLQKSFRQLQVVNLVQESNLIPGKKYPLSVGIKEALYETVLLTDADCVPATEHWITNMQAAFTPGIDIVLGYGAYYKRPGVLNKLIRWETVHTALHYLGFALAGFPYMGVGRNLAYKRDVFFRTKGFASINHIASGDDDLFINKVATKGNTAVVLEEDAFTFSAPKKTWKEWQKQKRRHFSTGKFYKPMHQFLLGLYSGSHALFYPLFVATLIFYDWRWSLLPLLVRFIIQAIVLKKAMKKLGEEDLYPWFPLLDIWMPVYYLIFASALWKKGSKSW